MLLIFTCENCGKGFKVDERMQGRRGRCSHCGHVMRIPRVEVAEHAHHAPAAADAPEAGAEPAFRLSPPEHRPHDPDLSPIAASHPAAHHSAEHHHSGPQAEAHAPATHDPLAHDNHVLFELLDDDEGAADAHVSPAVKRGLEEIAEFEKDRRGYSIVGDRGGRFPYFGLSDTGPAGWLYTRWRAAVNVVLRVLRWIDAWAYLLSVPFLMLMIFGIAVEHRPFVHTGAVVVVLANYGRFWADLLALFVRPFKDGPLQGLAFLFPPYTIYYLVKNWDHMKKIVRRIATSCIPIILVILIYSFLPSVNPDAKEVQGIGARLEAGKEGLEKDIQSDLESLEKKLIGTEKPEKEAPKAQP